MTKYYHIKKLDTENYPYIIFSKSYISPIENIDLLERELEKMGARGKVIFDFLLSSGDSPDRYFEAEFDGKQINKNSFKQIHTIPLNIKEASFNFYYNSNWLDKNSVLTREKKFFLKKGFRNL